MGFFGKKLPAYVPEGRGYEISSTGVALRAALLDGEPAEIARLAPDCVDEGDPPDKLAARIVELFGSFKRSKQGQLDDFYGLTCEVPAACPEPSNAKGELDQYMDFVCERLFKGALLMFALQDEQYFNVPEHKPMLDKFVEIYKWTKMHSMRPDLDLGVDTAVGIGKHFHTFDPVVGRLMSDHNIRDATRQTS